MSALRKLGWAIPAGEHDAHELLSVLLSSLSEQQEAVAAGGAGVACCLADKQQDEVVLPELELEQDGGGGGGMVRSGRWRGSSSALSLVELAQESSGGRHRWGSQGSLFTPSLTGLRRRAVSRSSLSLAGPGGWGWGWAAGDSAPPPPAQLPPQPPPFTGTLAHRLVCEGCGRRSPLRTEKFTSLTLALPEPTWRRGVRQSVRLHDLLARLTRPERLEDVRCEGGGCEGVAGTHVRHAQLARPPACLCLHVCRAVARRNKRHDHVHFPARLSLAPYTYLHGAGGVASARPPTAAGRTSTSEGGSPMSAGPAGALGAGLLAAADLADWRHTYQLAAVVVHCGEGASSGHYATYRRAHHQPTRWFLASDHEIREAHMDEVLAANAYMLFYERCATATCTVTPTIAAAAGGFPH